MQTPLAVSPLEGKKAEKQLIGRSSSLFDEFCQLNIFFGETTAVMGQESDLNLVVHIEPFWVMIHFLCLQSHTRHEPKGLVEIHK